MVRSHFQDLPQLGFRLREAFLLEEAQRQVDPRLLISGMHFQRVPEGGLRLRVISELTVGKPKQLQQIRESTVPETSVYWMSPGELMSSASSKFSTCTVTYECAGTWKNAGA